MGVTVDAATARASHHPGRIAEVAWLAYPVVLQTLSDTLMQVVDSAIVGHLGSTELAAVGFGGIWLWTMLCAFVGAATGVQTFVAQSFGAGETRRCGRWVWQALYVLLPVALVWFSLVAVFFEPLLRMLGPSEELQGFAVAFARMRLLGAPAVVAAVVLTSFFRGLGDTRTPLIVTVVANILNAVATYGFVYGELGLPAMGVAGAGVGTAVAQWTYTAILMVVFLRRRSGPSYEAAPVRPDFKAMSRFARTSAPIGGQWILDMASFAVFSTFLARMGDAQMAASQAMIQLLSLSFMQAYGISIASGALVGRYIGARNLDAAERSHQSALKLGMGLAAVVALLFVCVPELLLRIFTDDPEVLALGRPLLALAAVFQLIDAVGIIAGGSLRGAGDTRWPLLVQTTLAWFIRLPTVYIAAIVLEGGIYGAWVGELGYVILLASVWLMRFRNGAWREVRI